MKIDINNTLTSDNVPGIERQILIIKERLRACRHTLPFKQKPKVVLVYMLLNYALWINIFPPKGGGSISVSPCTILTGVKFDYNKHFLLKFDQYVQMHQ